MAGYSQKSLLDKLGIKDGFTVLFIHPPENYFDLLGKLPPNLEEKKQMNGEFDFIHFFTKDKKELATTLPKLQKVLKQTGMIWVSWPKGASKIKTDVNENTVRDLALSLGIVDVKVCAVDEIWSGLKLVIRKENRK
jgi:hypothetical protein